ncbi:MAG TPA: hypothetical protein DER11_07875 [Janibacter terrae]|nr:hypothetical protein [Janibacter terrae]
MKPTRPRSHPKPLPFVATGAVIGFIVFGLVSWFGPNRNEGFDITYDPGATLGYMSVLGLCVGGLVGAVVAALLTYRR